MMRNITAHALVLCAYLVVTLVMTLPLATRLSTHIAGSGGDPWQTLWRFEHKDTQLEEAVAGGTRGEYIAYEFLGGGEARLINISVWPWMPVYWLFGNPMAYNMVWLLSFLLSGYAIYLLVLHLAREEHEDTLDKTPQLYGVAFLAGITYMFLPFHIAHAQGHFGAMQTQWLPFSILAWLVFIKQPSIIKSIVLAVLLTILAWSEHHYMLWFVLFAAAHAVMYRKTYMSTFKLKKNLALCFFTVALLFITVVLPYYPTIKLSLKSDSSLKLGQEQTIRFSADLFSYIVPAPMHPLWGNATNSLFSQYFTGNATEATQFIGLSTLLLILFFHQHIPRSQKKFWLIILGGFVLISLGPKLHVFGRVLPISLPYDLLDTLPVFSSVRAVGRAGIMVGMSAAILLFWSLAKNIKRPQNIVLLLVIILVEFLFVPVASQSAQLSPVYSSIQHLNGKTLVEIPAATNYVAASRALYASHIHAKQVIGNIALERAQDKDANTLARSAPALRQMLYLRTTDLRQERKDFFDQDLAETLPDVLSYIDAAAIVIHTDSITDLHTSSLRTFLEERVGLTPTLFDDAVLYELPAQYTGVHDGVFVMRNAGFDAVAYDETRRSVFAELSREAEVTIVNTRDQAQRARITFTVADASRGAGSITRNGQVLVEFDSQRKNVDFIVDLEPGEHVLTFVSNLPEKVIIQNPRIEVID